MSLTSPEYPVTNAPGRDSDGSMHRRITRYALPAILLLLLVIASLTTPGFFTFDNLRAVLINSSIVGIVAVSMTPVTLSGNFFSLGAAQSTMLSALIFLSAVGGGQPIWVGVMVSLIVLIVIGALQAIVVAAGLNPIITTLAAGSVIFGVATFVTGGRVVTANGADISWIATESWAGLPLPVYAFFIVTLVVTLLVKRTVAGRRVSLLGANSAAAAVSGISAWTTTLWAFLIMSVGMALAGVLVAGQLGQITTSDLSSLTIDTVAAVLVGGTAIQGGDGSPLRSAVGALIIVILGNVMVLQGFPTGIRTLGVGLLVVIVVSVLHLTRKAAAR